MISLTKRLGQLTIILPKFTVNQVHSNAEIIANSIDVKNRNPRNLELLRIARKPTGYHLEERGREFWHKLIVTKTVKHLLVEIVHMENGPVISVSTKEWAIKKQLYKAQDRAAYLNIGRVMAQRCLESGILTVRCDIDTTECEKLQLLITEMEKGGIALSEPSRYIHAAPWDWKRYQKPWEVQE